MKIDYCPECEEFLTVNDTVDGKCGSCGADAEKRSVDLALAREEAEAGPKYRDNINVMPDAKVVDDGEMGVWVDATIFVPYYDLKAKEEEKS